MDGDPDGGGDTALNMNTDCAGPAACTDPSKHVRPTGTRMCVQCLAAGDCTADPAKPVCDTAANTCVGCLALTALSPARLPPEGAVRRLLGPPFRWSAASVRGYCRDRRSFLAQQLLRKSNHENHPVRRGIVGAQNAAPVETLGTPVSGRNGPQLSERDPPHAKRVPGGVIIINRVHSDQVALQKALASIRNSRIDGRPTLAAFILRRLEAAPIPTTVEILPTWKCKTLPLRRDERGRVIQVDVVIGAPSLVGAHQYPSGATRRLDTVLSHELAHAYGMVFESGVGLSQERAIKVENTFREAMGYERRDPDEDE